MPRSSRGVTLIELLVVLMVVAIAISLAGPSLINAAGKFGLASAGRQIVSTLRAARNEARAKQQELLAVLADGELIVDHGDGKRTSVVHLAKDVRVGSDSIPAMSGANASPVGRSPQEMSGANASPVGRSPQTTYTLLPTGQILGPQRLELILDGRYRVFVVLGPGPGAVRLEER